MAEAVGDGPQQSGFLFEERPIVGIRLLIGVTDSDGAYNQISNFDVCALYPLSPSVTWRFERLVLERDLGHTRSRILPPRRNDLYQTRTKVFNADSFGAEQSFDTVEAFEVWLHLAQGEGSQASLRRASRWVREGGLNVDCELGVDNCTRYVQWAQTLITLGREDMLSVDGVDAPLEQALQLLARLLDAVEAAGAARFVIKTLALQAVALQEAGDQDRAHAALLRALALAEPEGYVWAFVREGTPMTTLLQEAAARGIATGYANNLLAAFREKAALSAPRSCRTPQRPRERGAAPNR